MDETNTYKVLMGDPFGGYSVVEKGMTLEAAEKLATDLEYKCDYFTTTMVKPNNYMVWG